MIPVNCRVTHDPTRQTYGDCLRACIASVLEMDADEVPHFAHDGPSPEIVWTRIKNFLVPKGLAPFLVQYPGEPLETILTLQGEINPECTYLLFGSTGEVDHVVVCRGGKIIHNPAWFGGKLVGPGSWGFWQVMVIAVG